MLRAHVPLLLLLLLPLVVAGWAAPAACQAAWRAKLEPTAAPAADQEARGGSSERLPALFDFEHYKRTFGKSYASAAEELDRKRLYLARALRTYAVATKFKHYQLSHYNAVNDFSDWSPVELAKLTNNALNELFLDDTRANEDEEAEADTLLGDAEPEVPEFLSHAGENVEREVRELLGKGKGGLEQAADLLPGQAVKLRDLPLAKLINSGDGANGGGDEGNSQQRPRPRRARVRSNNRNYEAPEPAASFGLMDQQESVKLHDLKLPARDKRSVHEQLVGFFRSLMSYASADSTPPQARGSDGEDEDAADDLMAPRTYLDLRDTNCLSAPRSQGPCGSCYAFATVAIMEFLYCVKRHGELVEFSEQYMLDCGTERFKRNNLVMRGCKGGDVQAATRFVHNFGLELRARYPYAGRVGQCPYDETYDLKKTGFIRMEIGKAVRVPIKHWDELLKLAPMYLVAMLGPFEDFSSYGGGVDMCTYCARGIGYHAMVLVGHGREAGQDYWLMRNSYGTKWGERGYWKLAKTAAKHYVHAREAVLFGASLDGSQLEVEPRMSRARATNLGAAFEAAAARADTETARGSLAALLDQLGAAGLPADRSRGAS